MFAARNPALEKKPKRRFQFALWFLSALAAMLLTSAWLVRRDSTDDERPLAIVTLKHFGPDRLGLTNVAVFTVKNSGSGPIEIDGVCSWKSHVPEKKYRSEVAAILLWSGAPVTLRAKETKDILVPIPPQWPAKLELSCVPRRDFAERIVALLPRAARNFLPAPNRRRVQSEWIEKSIAETVAVAEAN